MLTWAVRGYLAVQALLVTGYAVVPGQAPRAVLIATAAGLSGLCAVLWAARTRSERRYRLGIAAALALVVCGALTASWIPGTGRPAPVTLGLFPWLSPTDAGIPVVSLLLFLSGGAVLSVALLGAGTTSGRISWGEVLDTIVAGTGLLVLVAHLGLLPTATELGGSGPAATVTWLAVQVGVAGVVALWSLRPARLVHPGALLVAVACGLWLVMLLARGLRPTAVPDTGEVLAWYLPVVMLTLACRTALGPDVRGEQVLASRRLAIAGMVSLVGPAGLLFSPVVGMPVSTASLGLATVVPLTAVLVRVVALLRTLERQASHDGLTGLLNRQTFEERAEALLARNRSGSVVLIDLDGFKRINDDFGHAVGDAVLSAVAARLSDVAPPGSLLARQGGDEFVMFLPLHTMVDADVLARALDTPFAFEDVRLARIPASIGIAVVDADFGSVPTSEVLDQLLTAADAAMYGQKAGPRRDLSRRAPQGVVTHLRPTVVASPRHPAAARAPGPKPGPAPGVTPPGVAQAPARTAAF